ncbi:MAG: dihydropteroate synthase-like protein [Desulfurococcaceae archaeon]
MRILLVTGRKAYSYVKRIVEENRIPGLEINIVEFPIDVAALITINDLLRELPKYQIVKQMDLIIVPGYVQGDLSAVSEKIGVRIVKGVKNARDIPLMLKAVMQGVLGFEKEPYDVFLHNLKIQRDQDVLSKVRCRALMNKYFEIRGVPISRDYPLVFAEIPVFIDDKIEDIVSKASRMVSKGADAIIYGVSEEPIRIDLIDLIKRSKRVLEKPIGLDSVNRDLFRLLQNHIDIYLSIYPDELDTIPLSNEYAGHALTVIPRNIDSIDELVDTANRALSIGLNKLILDPVLQPPMLGLTRSIYRYLKIREKITSYPLLMGVGNVIELIDADSIGIVAILASIGVEIGIEIYLATEASVKTRKAIYELRRALDMAIIARETGGLPKDLSIDLLIAKSKKESLYKPRLEPNRVVNAKNKFEFIEDPKGYVRISVDHSSEEIILEHYEHGRKEPSIIIKSNDPLSIAKEVISRELVSRLDHAIYIGVELGKAYKALKSGGEYEQE